MASEKISFKPKETVKKLLAVLPDRAREIISRRFGLNSDASCMTLEAIGSKYSITRERVRQIENFAINTIKKSEIYSKSEPIFSELKALMEAHGGIVHEQEFLENVAKDVSIQNHIHFLLVLGEAFTKLKEDDEFHHRWTTDSGKADKVHESLRNLCKKFGDTDLMTEDDLIVTFVTELKKVLGEAENIEDFAKRWIKISKSLGRNPIGEWGLAKSPNVKMRGIRDYAYLVLRKNGKPMHFTEVAKAITSQFNKKAHPATCHNELIKDKRFVLVGRGLYALAEWGYSRGVVRDIIKDILKTKGPLSKQSVIDEVMKQRHVKENTIIVNLQNPKFFKKNKDGLYSLAK
jgi:DNA-binding winged helix-turn-helix (wHTH) protein